MKRIVLVSSFVLGCGCLSAVAQSGTNSPYSQYGLGILADQSQGYNRGMNGLALGLCDNNQVNVLNPASYSAADSLTMIFDVGLSGQVTNFKENGKKLNARNADLEYVVGMFRMMPKVGISFGIIPYTNVGYNYYKGPGTGTTAVSSTTTYSGSGGFYQAFVGMGWNIFKNLSVGANLSYFWGSYDKSIYIVSADSYVNTEQKTYSTQASNYKIDLGLQWQQQVTAKGLLTIGATYGFGHSLNADAEAKTVSNNPQTGVSIEESSIVKDALSIPHSFGVGASWKFADKLTIGADYTFQKWGALDYPVMDEAGGGGYMMKSGLLKDRSKLTIGGEWVPNSQSNKFLNRVHYRAGVSYATPYIRINGQDGPKDISASAGFGIPVGRSLINISGQWMRSSAANLITENTFRINLGITFNERWFMKWKVE